MNELFDAVPLCFLKDGAQRFQGALTPFLVKLRAALDLLPKDLAGLRIRGVPGLQPFFAPDGALGSIAASALGAPGRAVRAILFDKTPRSNWSLPWHQDRTICVKQRINVEGFGPWTTKGGMQHVLGPGKSSATGLFQLTRAAWHYNPHGAASFGDAYEECAGGIRYIRDRFGTADRAEAYWRVHLHY